MSQKEVNINRVDITRNSSRALYRKDYDLGDIVTVIGSYDETTKKRITEYIESEDEHGESSYPTLSAV